MFEKKAPKTVEGDKGGKGEASIPVEPAKKPAAKRKKPKPKKMSVASEGQKGKISAMLGKAGRGIAADIFAELKAKKHKKRGQGDEGNKKAAKRFVPEMERTGIRG